MNTPREPHGDRPKQARKGKGHAPRAPLGDTQIVKVQRVEVF